MAVARIGLRLLTYLDVITSSARAKPALDVVATLVEEHCRIGSGVGEEVWRSDRRLP